MERNKNHLFPCVVDLWNAKQSVCIKENNVMDTAIVPVPAKQAKESLQGVDM